MGAFLQRCPVCEGRGIVPHGFYRVPAGQQFVSSGTGPERCRRCDGVGTITTPVTREGWAAGVPPGASAP